MTRARLVQPDEPLEHVAALLGGDSRTVVQGELGDAVTRSHHQHDPCAGMTPRVLDELPHQLFQQDAISRHLCGADPRGIDVDGTVLTLLGNDRVDDVVEIDRPRANHEPSRVRSS